MTFKCERVNLLQKSGIWYLFVKSDWSQGQPSQLEGKKSPKSPYFKHRLRTVRIIEHTRILSKE